MTTNFLDHVYGASDPDQVRDLYDDWSASYDDEITAAGYATPARLAALLAGVADVTAPLLDFGCGTGVSGTALAAAGFTTMDGMDVSAEMLAGARAKNFYRALTQIEPGAALPVGPGDYSAITAVGVIGVGAAPVSTFDLVMDGLAPGGLFAFSFNDHALEDPVHLDKLRAWTASGRAVERVSSYGDHLPARGSKSMIYVLEKA